MMYAGRDVYGCVLFTVMPFCGRWIRARCVQVRLFFGLNVETADEYALDVYGRVKVWEMYLPVTVLLRTSRRDAISVYDV